ncbi:MAG: MarR family transcriptional regulator [Amaricoccus sp.]|uniref:MarR family winged helix-turn-helix transcriptional regulator n=1 Tax=Amaricoccus sp. TaxID=1872485 RepID=UPI0039E39139
MVSLSPEVPSQSLEHEPVSLGPLAEALAFHIRMAQAASFRGFQRSAGAKRLKPGWFAVLSLINDNPGITAVGLSRAAGRDKSTMTPLLRELERDGLVARLGVPEDRRRMRCG